MFECNDLDGMQMTHRTRKKREKANNNTNVNKNSIYMQANDMHMSTRYPMSGNTTISVVIQNHANDDIYRSLQFVS